MTTAFEEDRLPWLEAVDDEDSPRPLPGRKMLAGVVMVLVAAAIVAGTFFLLGRKSDDVSGAPELIAAPDGPYKVKPDEPGGLDVAGESGTAFSTSAGEDHDSNLDLGNQSTAAPIAAPVEAAPTPDDQPKPVAKPEPPKPAPAEAAPAGGGSIIQLGAYASTAKASTAWKLLASRFPAVGGMSRQLETATVGGKTLYRLRATGSPDQARAACAALRAAGENCLVVK